jgi:hypothetical protein
MTSPVLAALANARINETAKHEADLAALVYKNIGRPNHAPEVSVPAIYEEFCRKWHVPSLPSRPTSCAGFALSHRGLDADELVEVMAGISRAHQAANFADPTASFECNVVLARFIKIEPPRSWTKDDRVEFFRLPVTAQAIVVRREAERDRALHQAQQKIADERKLLKAAAENVRETSEPKPETIEEKATTNVENKVSAPA